MVGLSSAAINASAKEYFIVNCDVGAPSSLLCKMILYMEQFIISSASAQHNPMLAPTCNKPPGSCDTMQCNWTNEWGTKVYHDYKFQRCSSPQSVQFILTVGRYVYNMTFWESRIVQLNTTTKLNFTLLHPSDTTIGLAVKLLMMYNYREWYGRLQTSPFSYHCCQDFFLTCN